MLIKLQYNACRPEWPMAIDRAMVLDRWKGRNKGLCMDLALGQWKEEGQMLCVEILAFYI